MCENSTTSELRTLLTEMCSKDTRPIGLDVDLLHELDLDSLAALRMLAAVEQRFGVRFPDDRLGDVRTLGQLVDLIERR